MKIAILDDYQDAVRHLDCFEMLDGHEVKVFNNSARGTGQLAIRLAPFDALVLIRERTTFDRQLLDKLPALKLISQTGKAGRHIDLAAASANGVAVVEGFGDPVAPAELTWALIMSAARRLPQYISRLQEGQWQTVSQDPAYNRLGVTLKGRTLGIWGYGKIGRIIAGYGRAFGMDVLIWGREGSRTAAKADGLRIAASRQEFFAQSDVLTLHLRLNDDTTGIVTAADLLGMKTDATLVNTSRAELIEPGALLQALQSGRPGYAVLDVYESEPLPPFDALLHMENVQATPHLGYVEQAGYELYFRTAFQNVLDFAAGLSKNLVNPEALTARRDHDSRPDQLH